MKKLTKLLSVLSAGVLAVCAAPVSAFAADKPYVPTAAEMCAKGFAPVYAFGEDLSLYSLGDIDMDGEVTGYDAYMIAYNYTGVLTGYPDVLTEDQLKLADLDGESVWFESGEKWIAATAVDATLTLTYAGLRNAGYEMTMEEFLAGF